MRLPEVARTSISPWTYFEALDYSPDAALFHQAALGSVGNQSIVQRRDSPMRCFALEHCTTDAIVVARHRAERDVHSHS